MSFFNPLLRTSLYIGTFLWCSISFAQSTSSPYSQIGLGELRGIPNAQFRSIGGVSTGVRTLGGLYNINSNNPASYSAIHLTTFDFGLYGSYSQLSQEGVKQNNGNFALGNINFGIPITPQSAMSFGLNPYSSVGYRYSNSFPLDTTSYDQISSGEGGLTKAYIGYGIQFGKHISVGFNVGYLFGNLYKNQEAEFNKVPGALNTKWENRTSVYGLTYDYGIQYATNLNNELSLTLGYSGNSGNTLKSKNYQTIFRTLGTSSPDEAVSALDSTEYIEGGILSVKMPLTHNFGISINKGTQWLIGADVHHGTWSDFSIGGVSQGLNNRTGLAIGGQYTPDVSALNYFSLVDYRLGIRYDKTQVKVGAQDINEMAITLGFGFPLPSTRNSTFHKINLSAEFGQRGTTAHNLVKENFINVHLGFTLNDRWFQRYKYD